MTISTNINDIQIPDFNNYKRELAENVQLQVDVNKLLVEVLGGLKPAGGEFNDSSYSSKVLIDGQFALVLRYKKKNGEYYPSCMLSFDIDNNGSVVINQLQGARSKSSYKVYSSFKIVDFYIELLEESFSKRGIYISVKDFPTGLENAASNSQAIKRYEMLKLRINALNMKYGLKKDLHDLVA